ncbi:CDC27 family protein [Paraburkholderia metrosideri]|uniref:Tetratricopeptide repeat protein n=1 Tax=Paraburkholderia metrosideri TaxID=580937 RepID=A0ABM8P2X0_9BURK|nr:CDC27 family protein [Paraburkholderia metrosideri]CAD6554786.1 hypothetical protein LMG28140_05533 [Paraburkholderia metrosideri]
MKALKLKIAPIGTCRIHGPLRKGVSVYPIKAHSLRNYGFVHSSAEALQQLRFMFGKASIPSDIQPVLFRPSVVAEKLGLPYSAADLYLVEISSRKLVTVDERPVQTNYLSRYFAEFFADRNRTRQFWTMGSPARLEERRAWLDQDPAFLHLSEQDRNLLARMVRRVQSDDEIEQEMQEIVNLIGRDKIVFVTHVDARTTDDEVIDQRHTLIQTVKSISARLEVPCYEPTAVMQEMGQANALENGGLDLTHYTDEFAQRICADWYSQYFLQLVDFASLLNTTPVVDLPDPAESIEAAWNSGNLLDASRRVHAVLRTDRGRPEHQMLLARMQSELGNYEAAIALIEAARQDEDSTEQVDELLMRCYFELERYQEAQRTAAALLGDERETTEILRICAVSATRTGEIETAIANWKRLFRISPDSTEAADAVLNLLEMTSAVEAAGHWADEVRAVLPTHGASYAVQWKRSIAAGDRLALLAVAEQAPRLEDRDTVSLARYASDRGYASAAAALLVSQDLLGRKSTDFERWVSNQGPQWLNDGEQALERDDLAVATDRIKAICQIDPTNRNALRAEWDLEKQLQKSARAAFVAKDYAKLLRIIDVAINARITFPELDNYRGRAADALGDIETAIHHLRLAADQPEAPVSVRLHLARVAIRNERLRDAVEAYAVVARDSSADKASQEEALRQLSSLRTRGIRAARELNASGLPDEAWTLLELIEQLTVGDAPIAPEKKRVISSLHAKIRLLDPASAEERMAVSETILRLAPDDHIGLKTAAVAAMRLQRFTQALTHWQALHEMGENVEYIEGNIKKCLASIERSNRLMKAVRRSVVSAA